MDCNRLKLLCKISSFFAIAKKGCGEIPVNEFVDIELIYGREAIVVKVNGELRYIGNDLGYIRVCEEDPGFNISAPVYITTWSDQTITAESLRVTEL